MDYKVKLRVFEGPLDLLLHLIDKAEVDIYEISIADITDQYMDYLKTMKRFQLEVASEFIVMAATLLEMKSKMLLPQKKETSLEELIDTEEEERDPRQELMERLATYRKYKAIAAELREHEAEQSKLYTRSAQDLSVYRPQEERLALEGISLYDLIDAVHRALRRAKETDQPMALLSRDELSVTDRMSDIEQRMMKNKMMRFTDLFNDLSNRSEIVVTFLAILEMMAKGQICCEQSERYAEITIRWKEN